MTEFDELVRLMSRLRAECPWDKKQTLESLRPYLLEEAYECLDAMNRAGQREGADLQEELGDLLLQILFQAEVMKEQTGKDFLKGVLLGLKDKLVRRHPHVFGDGVKMDNAEKVHTQWDEIKRREKGKSAASDQSLLTDIPKAQPAMMTAFQIGRKCQKIGFDWAKPDDVWKQFESEIEELKNAKSSQEEEHEIGDIYFSLIQWARHRSLDSEVALARANERFRKRFHWMEEEAKRKDQVFSKLTLEEMEELWKKAKEAETKGN